MDLSLPTLDALLQSSGSSSSSAASTPLLSSSSGTNYLQTLLKDVMGCVRAANSIPSGEEYSFRSTVPHTFRRIGVATEQTVSTISSLMTYIADEEMHAKLKHINFQQENLFHHQFESFQDCLEILADKIDFGLEVLADTSFNGEEVRQCGNRRKQHSKNSSNQLTDPATAIASDNLQKDEEARVTKKPNELDSLATRRNATIAPSTSFTFSSHCVDVSALSGRPQLKWYKFIRNFRPFFVPRIYYKAYGSVPLCASITEAQQAEANGYRAINYMDMDSARTQQRDTSITTKGTESQGMASVDLHLQSLGFNENGGTQYSDLKDDTNNALEHPYLTELNQLDWRILSPSDTKDVPIDSHEHGLSFGITTPIWPLELRDTPLVFVKTAKELREMINEINNGQHAVIGIDVEHHDYRSYHGFVCLVQISSRRKDWIIDPFEIYEEMHWLNEITANPRILKIFHGADNDGLWLQKDFSAYIVNLFDTYQAARALEVPGGFSLANIIHLYCNLDMDKRFQRTDWRVRPLTTKMKDYARKDAHYLPFLYDVMKNQLLSKPEKGGYEATRIGTEVDVRITSRIQNEWLGVQCGRTQFYNVMDSCRSVSLKSYFELPFDPVYKAAALCRNYAAILSIQEQLILIDMLKWRDFTARKYDESPAYVLRDDFLLRIATEKPTTYAQLQRLFYPLTKMMELLHKEIVDTVKESLSNGRYLNLVASPSIGPSFSNTEPDMSKPQNEVLNDAHITEDKSQIHLKDQNSSNAADVILYASSESPRTTSSTSSKAEKSPPCTSDRRSQNETSEIQHRCTQVSPVCVDASGNTLEKDLTLLLKDNKLGIMPTIRSKLDNGYKNARTGLEKFLFTPSSERIEISADKASKKVAQKIYAKFEHNAFNDVLSFPVRKVKTIYAWEPALAGTNEVTKGLDAEFLKTENSVRNTANKTHDSFYDSENAVTVGKIPDEIQAESAKIGNQVPLLPDALPLSIVDRFARKKQFSKTKKARVKSNTQADNAGRSAANISCSVRPAQEPLAPNLNRNSLKSTTAPFIVNEKRDNAALNETSNTATEKAQSVKRHIGNSSFPTAANAWMPAVFIDPYEIATRQAAKKTYRSGKQKYSKHQRF